MPPTSSIPYLLGVQFLGRYSPDAAFPFNLPILKNFRLQFTSRMVFFVGENGSGKSTVLEAIADLARLPVSGGGRNELADRHGPEQSSPLAREMRGHWTGNRPIDAFFFRGEFYSNFATLLDQRKDDPEFMGDPYFVYGGKSLHERSHGEAFLALLQRRLQSGLFLMDEPESALSPQRQLTLLAEMAARVDEGDTQFIIATHSPILLTFPGAQIVSFDDGQLSDIDFRDTPHYHITRGILECPERYWKHLRADEGEVE